MFGNTRVGSSTWILSSKLKRVHLEVSFFFSVPCSLWDLSPLHQESNLCPWQLKHVVLTTGLPENSLEVPLLIDKISREFPGCKVSCFRFSFPQICSVKTFLFWSCRVAYRILVHSPKIIPSPLPVKAQNPNHWAARQFPKHFQ